MSENIPRVRPAKATDALVTIDGEHGPLVTIRRDGAIEFGDAYDIDETARLFWHAVASRMPRWELFTEEEHAALREAIRVFSGETSSILEDEGTNKVLSRLWAEMPRESES
jgi:hypothetical protein